MASSKYSLQAVTTQTIVLLWIFLQGQALAKTYTSCKSRMYTYYTITSYCTNWLSTRCCYDKCCNTWDYSWNYKFSSCQSRIAYYQTCRDVFSTSCCRMTYGQYSTCCSTTNWWQTTTSTTSTWRSKSSTTYITNSNNGGVSLIGIVGGIIALIVIVIIVVVVSVICCGHRSAGRRGRVLGGVGNRNAVPMMAGAHPTTSTTVTHHPYPAQPQPGGYPNQYPQGPYPYPQGGPSYPQGPPQGSSAPYPPSTGVYAPPPSYDSALNMQMGSSMTELQTPNPSESAVPSAPYPLGHVGDDPPYPIQPAGMPPPRY